MKSISREEFQKRMKEQGWFDSQITAWFEDMKKAGLVVFDQKELSLSASSNERSLRIKMRMAKESWTTKEILYNYEIGKLNDVGNWVPLEIVSAIFSESLVEDKIQFDKCLMDLQKALDRMKLYWRTEKLTVCDSNNPEENWIVETLDPQNFNSFYEAFDSFSMLFSGFQGTFFAKEASPRKPECDNTSCEFELNGECTHPNPQIKPRDCLSWEKKIEPSSRTK
jgi:hypothetical protein